MTPIPYNQLLDRSVPIDPPYFIGDINILGYFLRADPHQLKYFVNSYLNFVPPEVRYFQPAAPFVLMLISNQQEAGQGNRSGGSRAGFIAESSVSFMVPLACYQKRGTEFVFKGWATLVPFAYSSDDSSVEITNDTFGWTYSLGWPEKRTDYWNSNPEWPNLCFSFETPSIPTMWQGDQLGNNRLLEVFHAQPPSLALDSPLDNRLLRPLSILNRLMSGARDVSNDLLSLFGWWSQSGLLRHSREIFAATLGGFGNGQGSLFPPIGLGGNIVSLKQFRDAEKPSKACYQGLLETPIFPSRISGFRLLGIASVLAGDITGGYRIRLNHLDTAPILSTLGLKTQGWQENPSPRHEPQAFISRRNGGPNPVPIDEPYPNLRSQRSPSNAILEPVFPFWLNCNLNVEDSKVLCWRLRDSRWFLPPAKGERRIRTCGHPTLGGSIYNTSLGSAMTQLPGPFVFSGVTTRLVPLRASKEDLQRLCDKYINISHQHHFCVLSDYAFIVVSDFGQMAAQHANLGSWEGTRVEFGFPVDWYYQGEKRAVAFVSPYIFTNSPLTALSESQTLGLNAKGAQINKPDNVWLDACGPVIDQPLLQLWLSTYPSISFGTYPRKTVLCEIIAESKASSRTDSEIAPETLVSPPAKQNSSKPDPGYMKVLRRRIFGRGKDSFHITLKQFPEASTGSSACYQAIVAVKKRYNRITHFNKIKKPLEVRFHQSPLYPIAGIFGIQVSRVEIGVPQRPNRIWQGYETAVSKASHYHWWEGGLNLGNSLNLAWRASGRSSWHHASHSKIKAFLGDSKGGRPTSATR